MACIIPPSSASHSQQCHDIDEDEDEWWFKINHVSFVAEYRFEPEAPMSSLLTAAHQCIQNIMFVRKRKIKGPKKALPWCNGSGNMFCIQLRRSCLLKHSPPPRCGPGIGERGSVVYKGMDGHDRLCNLLCSESPKIFASVPYSLKLPLVLSLLL